MKMSVIVTGGSAAGNALKYVFVLINSWKVGAF